MPVEEIIKELKKQDKIISEAQKEKMKLYELLENAGAEEYDWITVQAAAKIIGVSICTIYNKVNAGELETKHIKSAVRVRKSEILKINDL